MELFQLEDKNVQQRSAALELIFRCRPFKSPITYFTVLERAMRPFFLSFTSRTARSRRQSYQMALGSGQDLGSPSAGGGRAVPLSGFCPMPSGRRCPTCHPRDCANRPGKTAAGASRGRRVPHPPTIAQPQSGLATSALLGQDGGGGAARSPSASSQAGGMHWLLQVQAPRGVCARVARDKCCKQPFRVGKLLCARNSTELSSGIFFFSKCLCQTLRLKCRLHRDKAGMVSWRRIRTEY